MQAIMEPVFEIAYLVFTMIIGIIMIVKSGNDKSYRLFGTAALLLAVGDSFHLIPRMLGLITDTLSENVFALGVGTLITSITMTIFYVLIFHFWQLRSDTPANKSLSAIIYMLAIARIVLCLFPQNEWFTADSPLSWGIIRNIPFVIMGIILIVLFAKNKIEGFRFAPLAIFFSFLLYIPVVLWADTIPLIGMLMLPKTICYVWFIVMGYRQSRRAVRKKTAYIENEYNDK
ncbi:hypothetical protein AGMMS49983_18900 [Clostridia bacterium]|nr:hypothetical protein AGMMS49983_18750 [Clostridia bacterium]GHU67546.1 hypothetical protein AGMMS49983_18900 [Clostridia bacterium]